MYNSGTAMLIACGHNFKAVSNIKIITTFFYYLTVGWLGSVNSDSLLGLDSKIGRRQISFLIHAQGILF